MAPDTRIMAPKMMDTTFQKPKKFAARTMMSRMAKGMRKPYTITGPTHFTWTHPGTAPAGKAISLQCSRCKCIGTMKRKKTSSDREILHKCSTDDCAMEIINTIPSGANWVFSKPPVKGDPSGAWLVEYNLAVDQL